MLRATIVCLFLFIGTAAQAENMTEVRERFKVLIHAQTECFKVQSFSKSIKKVDLETAAYAVAGRCAESSQRFKAYSAAHNLMNPVQFEAYWTDEERKDLEIIKRLIANVRTP
jgi:hypothetical protein